MQILHPFAGSLQQYTERLADPDCYRPGHCPQCHAKQPLTAHGFYTRTLIDAAFDGVIRVRRYLCHACRRTVSLLPEFILPCLRSSLMVIALFLVARLLSGQTIEAAAPPPMPYQRGQFWIRRFRAQAQALCAAMAALTQPIPAPDFVHRALAMLESTGWITAHRFLSPACAATCWAGRAVWLPTAAAPQSPPPQRPSEPPHTPFAWNREAFRRKLPSRRKDTRWTTKPKKSRSFVTG